MVCWRVLAAGRWEGSVVPVRVWCVLEAGSLVEHVTGSDEGEDKHRFSCVVFGVLFVMPPQS